MDPIALAAEQMAISQVLARYSRGIDRRDPDFLRQAYWPDAYDEHGAFSGDTEAFIAWVIPLLNERYDATTHFLGQSIIEVDGDEARAETYYTATHVLKGQNAKEVVTGRYVDTLQKRGGQWGVFRRKVMSDWRAVIPLGDPRQPIPSQQGRRDREDPSYEILPAR